MTVQIGFTGTRQRLTDAQLSWLWQQFDSRAELHHGACIGADCDAHDAAIDNGASIVIHPPVNERLMMDLQPYYADPTVTVLSPKPYLTRNRDIVDTAGVLLAVPDGPERPKSGTWYTIRYAMSLNKRITICYPDGSVENRNGEGA